MSAALVSALAALLGALVGGLTSIIASVLGQTHKARHDWRARDYDRRHTLYSDFIQNAAECYADALQHGEADIALVIGLYAKIDLMRIDSSVEIIRLAEEIRRKAVTTYREDNKSLADLREMTLTGSIDLLSTFSRACRAELEALRGRL